MKRKIKFLTILFVSIVGLIMCDKNVEALTLLKEPQQDVWTYRYGGSSHAFSGPFMYYSVGGKTTYCIEPGVDIINEANLNGHAGFSKSPYNDNINQTIQLIGYYGFDYPKHQTLNYRMATQALIWETVGDQTVEFWSEASGKGTEYDISKEKEEINRLVNEHKKLPSFNNSTKNTIIGKKVNFTDSNRLLDDYDIVPTNEALVEKTASTLSITPNVKGEITIQLKRKSYTQDPTTLFVGLDYDTQIMAFFGYYEPEPVTVKVNVEGIRLELTKFDQSGTKTPKGDGTLEGAVYGVFKEDDTRIGEIITESNGIGYFDLPSVGTYYVKEEKASRGYLVDSRKFSVTVTESDLNPRVRVYETAIQKYIEIYKYLSDGKTGEIAPEANITFEFYLKSKMTLAASPKTDNNGHLKIYLPYGTYLVKQKDTIPGYEKVKDFEIVIDENSPSTITKVITNMKEVKEAYLKVIKIDSASNKVVPLDGIKFKIKNKETNEYICQNTTYPKNEKICEFTTENGSFITPLPLEYGNYILEEVENQLIPGYVWNSHSYEFSISENSSFDNAEIGKIFVVKFANDEVKGKVTIHKLGEVLKIKDQEFLYDEQLLDNVTYELYASENIYRCDKTLAYKKNELIGTYTTENGKIEIENLYLGTYYLKEIKTNEGYLLKEEPYVFTIDYIDQYTKVVNVDLEFKNDLIKGQLMFNKIDAASKEGLKNTTIAIYDINSNLIYEGKTDENGQINLKNIPYGKYYLIEKESPEGYILNDEKIEFSINNDQEIIQITMENKLITGSLKFTKIDSITNLPLKGCKIQIYTANNDLIYEGETNQSGNIEIENLAYGKYYIMEKEAPMGYLKDRQKYEFNITNNEEIVELTMDNKPILGKLEFTKIDNHNNPLSQVKINIYNENDELITQITTDTYGKAIVDNLKYGNYYLLEVETLPGYIINKNKIEFSIQNDGDLVKIVMPNKQITGAIEFTKIDKETGDFLKGAKITIYDIDNKLIYEGITNEEGKILVKDLKPGNYYLIETEAPEGYILDSRKIEFTIEDDNDLVQITMSNEKMNPPIIFKVPKTASNFDYLLFTLELIGLGISLCYIYVKKN